MIPLTRAGVCDPASSSCPHHLECLSGQLTELLWSSIDLKVYSVIADICVALVLQSRYHVDNLRYGLGDFGIMVGSQDVHGVHDLEVVVDVPVGDH